ncbi:phage tail assembly protein [Pseudomonas sp. FSL R10-0056]|uniref:phage tail assembly protein n=1 Tax=unclassified Pseudomonas TaxID=196821 RepID=UPI001297DA13|nr:MULTISPECIES: phage tail assembly protein [unclassified Pseudomonas]MQT61870.1 phage tail assembly protein [Pseudomonas sp. FSL R10-0056]MQT71281.1 phage tail assembly protein [Pseudomonas sp. FSL R10-0071]MQU51134.1 phage tail assembly protein [Pseudomonas sp. FSL A6-1183]
MTTMKKLPSWLELTEEGATITLRRAVEINQIKVNRVSLRAPTVKDVQLATVQSGGDAEKRELILFASLTQAGDKDIGAMTVVDYNRLQAGYFRLVEDDEPYPYND